MEKQEKSSKFKEQKVTIKMKKGGNDKLEEEKTDNILTLTLICCILTHTNTTFPEVQ